MARFAVVTGISLALGFGAHWSLSRTIQNGHDLERSHTILEGLQDLLLLLRDAESGQRGFLLAGKESYLKPYKHSVRSIGVTLGQLQALASDDPKMRESLSRVERLVKENLGEMGKTISLFKQLEAEEALRIVKTDRGKELMTEIRSVIGAIVVEERARLKGRDESAASWTTVMFAFFWSGALLNAAILVVVYRVVAREMANRRAAEAALRQSEGSLRRLNSDLEGQKSTLAKTNSDLSELAAKDGLTGLVNRRYTDEALLSIHSRSVREQTPLTLVFLDVDHFKRYNDDFGHIAGDEVLKTLAKVLRKSVRDCDLIGRYGGEEFVVLLPGLDAESGTTAAERLRMAVEHSDWSMRNVTASLGVATLIAGEQDVPTLLACADRALYASKQRGRNRVTHARSLVPSDDGRYASGASRNGTVPSTLVLPRASF